MKRLTLFLCTAMLLSLLSCKKESSNSTSGSLNGTYKFISMDASTISTTEVTTGPDVEKTITFSHYITKNNQGTLVITPTTMATNNVSYVIDTTMVTYSYSNGVLNDSTEMPFQYTASPSSSSAPYKMIGSDSAYFSSGSMFSSGISQQTIPTGVKFKTSGNRLYMIIKANQTNTQSAQGSLVKISSDVNSTVTLEKM